MTQRTPAEIQYLEQNRCFLALHGAKLLEQGYSIVPIKPGKKAPGYDGWQKSKATRAQLKEWLDGAHSRDGVGILTKNTPAIDIDVRDEDVALKLEKWVRKHIGEGLLRIGKAPKRAMLFRTDEPFRKMRSTKYTDEWCDEHQIEILGEGQQLVAYHIHPETGKPYTWVDEGQNPLSVLAEDLPIVTIEQIEELMDYFDELAKKAGWESKTGRLQASKSLDPDNPFVEDTAPVTIDDSELRNRLMTIPHPEDYEEWLRIGMALYHQYDGEEIGLKMWHEWAETADNYDQDALDTRWSGFNVVGKKRAPITARYIIKLAQEAVENTSAEVAQELHNAFLSAKTLPEWEKARKMAREAEIDGVSRSGLATIAKSSRDQITGTKTSLVEIKKAIAFTPKKTEKAPGWAKTWLYDTSDDKFFCSARKIMTSQQGFNAMYDRQALTKKDVLEGRLVPSSSASALALNMFKIPTVVGRRYMPGRDAIFTEPDGTFANTYPEHEIPEMPDKLSARDKKNIERVKAHIRHLIADESEQRALLDWMSWIVQNPGEHVRYAALLQGVQGDGKTFFAEMMRAVMGVSNVTMLNAHILHSDFTDWAEGQCLACVEEVRLINDKNKFEVLNRIKPYITNTINEIHPKGRPVFNSKNTTSYMLFTNYKDALPIDDTDRRYLVLFSRWQKRDALIEFMRENPDYYSDLYATFQESAGALRRWLLGHEQSDEFNAMGNAPETTARRQMIQRAKPEFIQQLEILITQNEHVGISNDLVDMNEVQEALFSNSADMPAYKSLTAMMERNGFEQLGRIRLADGEKHSLYSRNPEKFYSVDAGVETLDSSKIRKFLRVRDKEIDQI